MSVTFSPTQMSNLFAYFLKDDSSQTACPHVGFTHSCLLLLAPPCHHWEYIASCVQDNMVLGPSLQSLSRIHLRIGGSKGCGEGPRKRHFLV